MRAIRANNSRQEANESPNEIFLVSEGKEDHLRYVAERVSLVRFERDETTSRYGKAGNGGDDSKDALKSLFQNSGFRTSSCISASNVF